MSLVRWFESRYWGWWYLCISIGFMLLAFAHALLHASPIDIALRVMIAIGFGMLAWMQFHFGR